MENRYLFRGKRKIISKIDGKWCGGTFNEYCDRCGQKLDWRDEE